MNAATLTHLLQIAGFMHLGLICAGSMMPGVVNLRAHLSTLPAFVRQLFWVYYSFIALCLIGFGSLTVTLAGTLAGGGALARGLCLFLAAFWTTRLVAATFVFELRPYLTTTFRRIGYYVVNLVFVYLPVVYLLAAWKGGKP
jgi:hypothetical protein